jgi:hypothetical protein
VLVTAVKDVVPDVPMPRKMSQDVDAMDRKKCVEEAGSDVNG